MNPKPLSIKVIAIFHLMAVFAFLDLQRPSEVLGLYLTGLSAICYSLFLIALGVYVSFGLWNLAESVRKVAIGWQVFTVLNRFASILVPSARARYLEETASIGFINLQVDILLDFLLFIISTGLIIGFLIKRKSAFVKPKEPPQS